MTLTLQTDRLSLRPFVAADGPALFGYLSQPRAVEFEPYDVCTLADAMTIAASRATDPAFLAVHLRDDDRDDDRGDDRLVGNLYLAPHAHPDWATWEIGYVFDPRMWGHGYATEACQALIDLLFSERSAHRVVARCNPENTRSWALLERLGLRREAHQLAAASFSVDAAGQRVWHDTYQYAQLAHEWRANRGPGLG